MCDIPVGGHQEIPRVTLWARSLRFVSRYLRGGRWPSGGVLWSGGAYATGGQARLLRHLSVMTRLLARTAGRMVCGTGHRPSASEVGGAFEVIGIPEGFHGDRGGAPDVVQVGGREFVVCGGDVLLVLCSPRGGSYWC